MNAAQGLIQFVGQKLGLTALSLDENLQATITLDESATLTFLAEEHGELTAVAYVADYDGNQEKILRHLLQLNFLPAALGGGKLGLSPKDGAIILTRIWDASMIDGQAFYLELERFINSLMAIQKNLSSVFDPQVMLKKEAENLSPLMMYNRIA